MIDGWEWWRSVGKANRFYIEAEILDGKRARCRFQVPSCRLSRRDGFWLATMKSVTLVFWVRKE